MNTLLVCKYFVLLFVEKSKDQGEKINGLQPVRKLDLGVLWVDLYYGVLPPPSLKVVPVPYVT